MNRNVFLALVVVGCLAAPVTATVTVTAGHHVLNIHDPGQVLSIFISSDVPQGIQSADLGLEVQSGGPLITAVDMTSLGTVFGDAPGGNTGQSDFEPYPTLNQLSSIATTSGDTLPATGGVLANVTFDPTGTPVAIYSFKLIYSPFFLPTSTSSIPSQSTILVDGTIFVSPEPSSIIMGLLAAAGMGGVAVRRRWQQRRRR